MVFLFRDAELGDIARAEAALDRQHLHVLVVGLRQVGKTALVQEHQRRATERDGTPCVFVRGANITGPETFFRGVYEGLVDALHGTAFAGTIMDLVLGAAATSGSDVLVRLVPLYAQCWNGTADPAAAVQTAWRLPEMLGQERGGRVLAAVDEVQEVFQQLARTVAYRGAGGVGKVAWDARGQIQHNVHALWLFTTSIRTAVRLFFHGERSPFYLQTRDIRLDPLAPRETSALAAALRTPRRHPPLRRSRRSPASAAGCRAC